MNRTEKGFEARFRALLQEAGARRLPKGLNWLWAKAAGISSVQKEPRSTAAEQVTCELLRRVGGRRTGWLNGTQPKFFCDAGLGGLARWLHAAGYEAVWEPGIQDAELLKRAADLGAIVITTDSGLMERRILREAIVRSFWLAPKLRPAQQLELVLREFRLPLAPALCMNCGGRMAAVDREAMRPVIPPRTYLWQKEFFRCESCGKILWHGTHWEKIQKLLLEAEAQVKAFWSHSHRAADSTCTKGKLGGTSPVIPRQYSVKS